MTLHWYTVLSPTYTYVEPVLDDGTGPRYETCDLAAVEAHNAKKAKVLALRKFRDEYGKFNRDYLYADECPFKGMKATRFDPAMEQAVRHGIMTPDGDVVKGKEAEFYAWCDKYFGEHGDGR